MSGGPITERGKTQFSSASEVTAARKKNVIVGYYNNNQSSQKSVPGSLYTSFLGGIKNIYGSPVNISAYRPSFSVNIPQPSVVTTLSSGGLTPGTTVDGVTIRVVTSTSSSAFTTGPISYTYTSISGISPGSGTASSSGLTFLASGIPGGNSFNANGVIGTTPLTGASFVSFSVSPIGAYPNLVVVGLTTSPGSFTAAGGNSKCIDYGICPGGDNTGTSIRLYDKSGNNGFYNFGGALDNQTNVGTPGVWQWNTTDVFAVVYDGTSSVHFYSNATLLYSISKGHGTTALVPMASFVNANMTVSNLTFGSNYGVTTTYTNTVATSFTVPSGKYATTVTTASAYALNAANTFVQASTIGEKKTLNMNVAKNSVINNPQ